MLYQKSEKKAETPQGSKGYQLLFSMMTTGINDRGSGGGEQRNEPPVSYLWWDAAIIDREGGRRGESGKAVAGSPWIICPLHEMQRTKEQAPAGRIDRRRTKRPQEEQLLEGMPLAQEDRIVTGGGQQHAPACTMRTLFQKQNRARER